jgi:hypothetical protein
MRWSNLLRFRNVKMIIELFVKFLIPQMLTVLVAQLIVKALI